MVPKHKFVEKRIRVPKHDCDVVIELPGGKTVLVQLRPSNVDEYEHKGKTVRYNGSLDIILPENTWVTNWVDDEMAAAPAADDAAHERFAKQLCLELPGDYHV